MSERTDNARIQFDTRAEAEEFATLYTRKTLRGHTISASDIQKGKTEVSVYDMSEDELQWVRNYVKESNRKKENENG